MCGIAGIAVWAPVPDLVQRVAAMAQQLRHRGPDGAGAWHDAEHGIGFGHRRLAIIDLSPAGHQPMTSASGRFVIAYNGEIYNYAAIRAELAGAGRAPVWRGHSDTEALLAGFEAWGIEATLRRTVGMFAMAVWDREARALTLARDRLGEKPLYYGAIGGRLHFASELKALRCDPQGAPAIDPDAVAAFMRFGYVPTPLSIYRGIHKLPAGHWLTLRSPTDDAAPQPYWSADAAASPDERARWAGRSDAELLEALHERLGEAVALQMVSSDVPIGAFLSGGVDSSAIVALMQARSDRPVRTFTIGFDDAAFDEAPHARAVARHLGTDHTELRVDARAALDLIAELPAIYDEPFGDSSQIPTTLVARMTRRHVTVSLSGDGGDELFAGYPRYPTTAALWQRAGRHGPALRGVAAQLLGSLSARSWDRVLACLPRGRMAALNGRRLHRLAQMLPAQDLGEAYLRLMSHWQPEQRVVPAAVDARAGPRRWAGGDSPIAAMRRWDLGQYLPDDLLVKVDRAAMSASLESRAPFLDHRVVELALALPERVLVRDGSGKWLLRQLLDRYVPRALIERPKAGFEVPLAAWLRGPLRDWGAALLDRHVVARGGLLDAAVVERAWHEHQSGRFDRAHLLWNALMLQAWQQQPAPAASATAAAAQPAPCPA